MGIFDGFLEPGGIEVLETPGARAQRLESDSRWMEAQRLARVERTALEYQKKLVEPVLGQEEIHFVDGKDGSTYREPPKSEIELLRAEVDALRKMMCNWVKVRKGQIVLDLVCFVTTTTLLIFYLFR